MKLPRILLLAASMAGLVFAGAACSKKSEHSHAHDHPHTHAAPHGGTLVELGDHQFNLEWVRDAEAGTLTAYVLDAHADNFVRVPWPVLGAVASWNGKTETLALEPVANAATGETVGATSQFTVQAEWIKRVDAFDVRIPALEIRGARFTDVAFRFPRGEQPSHKH